MPPHVVQPGKDAVFGLELKLLQNHLEWPKWANYPKLVTLAGTAQYPWVLRQSRYCGYCIWVLQGTAGTVGTVDASGYCTVPVGTAGYCGYCGYCKG